MILQFTADSVNSSLAPWLYKKMESDDKKEIEKTVISVTMGIMMLLGMFILVAPEAIYVLAGAKYLDAVKIVPCITSSILCIFIYQLVGNIEFFYDANKFTMFVSGFGAVLNLILNFIAIPIWG